MTSDEIRERYLAFFEQRGHRRIPSASLVPSSHDPSALLTVAGMHPLKPYFLGQEAPPAKRLTDCQKVFRTVDIDNVGNTARHLTFFEMLGNFSFGDYFKREAIEFAWELSREVFGFPAEQIWVTVFEGDEGLDLGPDEEAISFWLEMGVPRERIVECPRSENFWQAGPEGPCGPCSELYLDRGVRARHGRGSAGRRERALSRVLEPRVHAVRPARRRADAAAGAQHRHRHGPEPDGGDPAAEAIGLRDRPVSAVDRARRAALRRALRLRARQRPCAADLGRPFARDDVSRRRRRRAVERGARLRAAPRDAPRDPAGPCAGASSRLPDALCGARQRGDGRGLSGDRRACRDGRHVAGGRGGGVRAHACQRHGAAARGDRAARAIAALARSLRRPSSACTTRMAFRAR